MKAEKQLYLENHATHEGETCTVTLWISMILVLFAYCIAGVSTVEKIRKSTVRSIMEQPTQFPATPLSAQGSYGDEYRVQQQGLVAFQQCWNLVESCFRKGSGSGV